MKRTPTLFAVVTLGGSRRQTGFPGWCHGAASVRLFQPLGAPGAPGSQLLFSLTRMLVTGGGPSCPKILNYTCNSPFSKQGHDLRLRGWTWASLKEPLASHRGVGWSPRTTSGEALSLSWSGTCCSALAGVGEGAAGLLGVLVRPGPSAASQEPGRPGAVWGRGEGTRHEHSDLHAATILGIPLPLLGRGTSVALSLLWLLPASAVPSGRSGSAPPRMPTRWSWGRGVMSMELALGWGGDAHGAGPGVGGWCLTEHFIVFNVYF